MTSENGFSLKWSRRGHAALFLDVVETEEERASGWEGREHTSAPAGDSRSRRELNFALRVADNWLRLWSCSGIKPQLKRARPAAFLFTPAAAEKRKKSRVLLLTVSEPS